MEIGFPEEQNKVHNDIFFSFEITDHFSDKYSIKLK